MTPPAYVAHHRASDGMWQPLAEHLIGVAALAREFAGKLGLAGIGELLGLLHDLGKYSKEFQAYIKSALGVLNQDADEDWVDAADLKGKVDHSTAGAQWVWHTLANQGAKTDWLSQTAALCIASHHSGLIDCVAGDARRFGDAVFLRRIAKLDERTHLAEVEKAADRHVLAPLYSPRTTQRNPTWLVEVSTGWGQRAAGRYRWQ